MATGVESSPLGLGTPTFGSWVTLGSGVVSTLASRVAQVHTGDRTAVLWTTAASVSGYLRIDCNSSTPFTGHHRPHKPTSTKAYDLDAIPVLQTHCCATCSDTSATTLPAPTPTFSPPNSVPRGRCFNGVHAINSRRGDRVAQGATLLTWCAFHARFRTSSSSRVSSPAPPFVSSRPEGGAEEAPVRRKQRLYCAPQRGETTFINPRYYC